MGLSAITAMAKDPSPTHSAAVIHIATPYGYSLGTGSTRSSVQKNTYPGTIRMRYVTSRTVPLVNTCVYQDVKYIVIGTATSSSVVIAGNVTTLAARLLTAPWRRAATPGEAR